MAEPLDRKRTKLMNAFFVGCFAKAARNSGSTVAVAPALVDCVKMGATGAPTRCRSSAASARRRG